MEGDTKVDYAVREHLMAEETKAQESKIIPDALDRSREELEPQKPDDKVIDADASAADDSAGMCSHGVTSLFLYLLALPNFLFLWNL